MYKSVLRNDPKNIWAANGIGNLLDAKSLSFSGQFHSFSRLPKHAYAIYFP